MRKEEIEKTIMLHTQWLDSNYSTGKCANFTDASLTKINLAGINLSHAIFANALLNSSDLSGANLSHCNFSGADLTNTDLTNADLSYTNLTDANIHEAILNSNDFQGAYRRGKYKYEIIEEFDMKINDIAKKQWDWVERMGWHNKSVLEALALVASEVGEAVNECRGPKPSEHLGEELADIILRTLDLAKTLDIDIENEISKKMAINEQRGTKGRVI